MNRRLTLLIAWLATCSTVAGQDQGAGAADQASAMAQMQQRFLQQFDVNRDGVLSDPEKMMAQEAMRRQGWNLGMTPAGFPGADGFAKQFDRDGDGKLNAQEMAAAQAAFNRMRGNGNAGARGGIRSGGNAGAVPPQPVLPAAPAGDNKKTKVNPYVKRFDKDGDGKLNDKEKAEAQAEFKKGKTKDAKADKGKDKDADKEDPKPAKKGAAKP